METNQILIVLIAAGVIGFVIAIVVILRAIDDVHDDSNYYYESPKRLAGKQGEMVAANIIRGLLREKESLYTNVEIEYEGKRTELDCVVVNRFGVFIFEVKNYSGILTGNEEDYEWSKYKMTAAGNEYYNVVNNPIKQVKRQVYILANI